MKLHYPLDWPQHQSRSKVRTQSAFGKHSVSQACTYLAEELRKLNAVSAILSTNLGPLTATGYISARAKVLMGDPGVAVYFTRKGQDLVMACDQYTTVEQNVWALAKTIEALRGIERWGSAAMMDQAFTGFAALPAPNVAVPWYRVLDVDPDAPEYEVEAHYRTLAFRHHPDRGGDPEKMAEINSAIVSYRAKKAGA